MKRITLSLSEDTHKLVKVAQKKYKDLYPNLDKITKNQAVKFALMDAINNK